MRTKLRAKYLDLLGEYASLRHRWMETAAECVHLTEQRDALIRCIKAGDLDGALDIVSDVERWEKQ